MKFKIVYTIKGIMSFVPFSIEMEADTEDDLKKISDDDVKEEIMKKDSLVKEKGIDSITLYR